MSHLLPRQTIQPIVGIVCLTLLGWGSIGFAGDWPQILGPNRNGVAVDESLADRLPTELPVVWRQPLGEGYAGPAVVGDRVFVFHRVDDAERLEAFDRATGQPRWHCDFAATYSGGIDSDTGPRCVPVVDQGRVVVYGAAGRLHCVDAAGGQLAWSRDLVSELEGNDGYFGAGSTPLVLGDRVLVNVGGRAAGLIGLSLQDGKTLWQATDEAASYSSPVAVQLGKQSLVVFVTRLHAVGVDPRTGEVQFRIPFGRRGPTVNAATPVVYDRFVFLTANYGVGAQWLRLADGEPPASVWTNDDSLSSQYNTPIYHQGHLFGIHGREDVGRAELRCVEAATGRVVWSVPEFGVGHLLLVDEKLLILTPAGTLILLRPNPQRYEELSRCQVARGVTRALPAVSQGRLYFRTQRSDGGELVCAQLSPETAP